MKTKKSYLLMLIGTVILAFGYYQIHTQNAITEGGVLGLILLLSHHFPIPASIVSITLDLTCLLIGYKILGRTFLVRALFAAGAFAIFYFIFEKVGPILPSLMELPFLASILGAIFVGVGVGLVISGGGIAGGDDVLAILFHRRFKLPLSYGYVLFDFSVLALSLSYIHYTHLIYSCITVLCSSYIIQFITQKLDSPLTLDSQSMKKVSQLD